MNEIEENSKCMELEFFKIFSHHIMRKDAIWCSFDSIFMKLGRIIDIIEG